MSAVGPINEYAVSGHLIFLIALPVSPGHYFNIGISLVEKQSPHGYSFFHHLKEQQQRNAVRQGVLQLNGKLFFTDTALPSAQL